MGKVCRICDHKFFLRAKFENYAQEIDQYRNINEQCEAEEHMKQCRVHEL